MKLRERHGESGTQGCALCGPRTFYRQSLTQRSATPLAAQTASPCSLRDFGHSLPIQIHFADAFDAREHVVNRLAADAHQFRANNARHEIARQIEDLPRRGAFETFAKN